MRSAARNLSPPSEDKSFRVWDPEDLTRKDSVQSIIDERVCRSTGNVGFDKELLCACDSAGAPHSHSSKGV